MQHDDDEQRGSEELKYERRTALRRPAKEGGRRLHTLKFEH